MASLQQHADSRISKLPSHQLPPTKGTSFRSQSQPTTLIPLYAWLASSNSTYAGLQWDLDRSGDYATSSLKIRDLMHGGQGDAVALAEEVALTGLAIAEDRDVWKAIAIAALRRMHHEQADKEAARAKYFALRDERQTARPTVGK
jgi:hypothetical protein